MHTKILAAILLFPIAVFSQKTENLIIITTDGLRWQEVFKGMDSAIADNHEFNEGDSQLIYSRYWAVSEKERKQRLLPFFWSTVAAEGQIYGNRVLGNKVDNANPYWFSYPGYSEILTGYADTAINRNDYPPNPHVTVLEFLNRQPAFKNKIAVFGAWDAFDRIVNEKRSGIPVICAFDTAGGKNPTSNERFLNKLLRDAYKPWNEAECLDVFTHHAAFEWLKTRKPRVMMIAYGETDEWAHAGKYRSYLDAARQVDEWIGQLWSYLQADPQYRGKTTIIVTTDHGRGDIIKKEWTSHGNSIKDASQMWMAVMGPDTPARGEVDKNMQIYQQQIAQTVARLLGQNYKAAHPVAAEIPGVIVLKK